MFLSIILIIVAYLLGSIASAIIVCKIMGLEDPRTLGSGNPGATNVLRQGNKTAAALTLLFDLLKGTLAVLLAQFLTTETWVWASVATAAVLGHLFPIFFNFKGGKGVATGFGVFLALSWTTALAMLATWLIVAVIFRYSSLAALITTFLAPFYMFFFNSDFNILLATAIISLLLMWKHKKNAINLVNGTEQKIGAKKIS
jgi:acyl phosphate:glycerol-3-phosphate acyltransferase